MAEFRSAAAATFSSWAEAPTAKIRARKKKMILRANNHHLRGFNQCGSNVSLPQSHLRHLNRCDDAGDNLPGNGKFNLGQKSLCLDLYYAPDELIAPADSVAIVAGLRAALRLLSRNETFKFQIRDSMVAARRSHGGKLSTMDPFLQCGVTHTQPHGRISWFDQHVGCDFIWKSMVLCDFLFLLRYRKISSIGVPLWE